MTQPLIVIAAGGHAKVLIDALRRTGVTPVACVDADPRRVGDRLLGVPVVGDDDWLRHSHAPGSVLLINGVGGIGDTTVRQRVFERFSTWGYNFATVVDPSAIIAQDVELGEGTQILAGAILQPGTRLGHNSIVNTRAAIDHDGCVGAHCHIAPGAILSGAVTIADNVHVGTGAAVVQGVRIATRAIVGAGAVVIRDIGEGEVVVGNPARVIRR